MCILPARSAFEEAETIDEMKHKIAAEGVGLRIHDVVGGDATGDIAPLVQDVVHLETEGSLVVFQERFRDGGIP